MKSPVTQLSKTSCRRALEFPIPKPPILKQLKEGPYNCPFQNNLIQSPRTQLSETIERRTLELPLIKKMKEGFNISAF